MILVSQKKTGVENIRRQVGETSQIDVGSRVNLYCIIHFHHSQARDRWYVICLKTENLSKSS